MASSRDDFIIAIRSAFLKKSTKQKFSLLTLAFLSIFIIVLSNLNLKPVILLKSAIKEVVYRSSFIVSIPENLIISSYFNVSEYTTYFKKFQNTKEELEKLKSENISSEIIKSENEELKNLIDGYIFSKNKILAKVIVDHDSPFLKTIIINKGSKENIKIGTNIYDRNYLVGRVIEVNFKTSRVLLLTDLNSSVPVSITPNNVQAIIVGNGDTNGEIKYIKGNFIDEIENNSIAYTSGTGSIFDSGTPVGRVKLNDENPSKKVLIDFYSDFSQLKYVYAEIENIIASEDEDSDSIEETASTNTEKIKLDLINEEVEIFKESNLKFIEENESLKKDKNNLIEQLSILQKENELQKNTINQNNIDKEELEFLRLNLIYSHKCQSKKLFSSGFKVGTKEYKDCIMRKGKMLND
jgi:rod shape-determining protein MreC